VGTTEVVIVSHCTVATLNRDTKHHIATTYDWEINLNFPLLNRCMWHFFEATLLLLLSLLL